MNMNLSDERIVGDGHTIKALTDRVAQLEAAHNALQKSFEQESGDVDTLLALLQLNPHDYRSDAGWLLLHKIHAVIAARNAERDALREQLAKSCSEDQRHAFGGCPIANGLTARVAELEADLQNYGWHAATCANAWPNRACDCGFKEAIDKIRGDK